MTYFRVDPTRMYETPNGVCKLSCAAIVTTVANNQQVVAAVSGKRIRVMGWLAQSVAAAVGAFTLKSASGGTALMTPLYVPAITAGACEKLPIVDSGYMETVAGEGLFVDVITAAINLDVFYIIYAP